MHAHLHATPLLFMVLSLMLGGCGSSTELPQASGWSYFFPYYAQGIAFSPSSFSPEVTYICGIEANGITIRRSVDDARTWSASLLVGPGRLCTLTVDPTDAQSVMLTSYTCPRCYGGHASDHQDYVSTDGGATWSKIGQAPKWGQQVFMNSNPQGAPPLSGIRQLFHSPDGTYLVEAIPDLSRGGIGIYSWRQGQASWQKLSINYNTTPHDDGFTAIALQSDAAGHPTVLWASLVALLPDAGCGACEQDGWFLVKHAL
jgi:hypothetical protein